MPSFVDQAVQMTLASHPEVVRAWQAGTPKSWGELAGHAVGNARRSLGRALTDGERRQIWAALWQRLQTLE